MSDIYIPLGSFALDKITTEIQLRVGLQGPPGVGKTWGGLTFPNPIVLNLDRGLGAHTGRTDVIEIPFWNPKFVDNVYPRSGINCPPNRRDAILKWLSTEGMKLKANQSLVIDSNTQLQTAFLSEYKINPVITKNGKIDDFGEWNQKVVFFGEVMDLIKAIQCHVVYIAHETLDRDKTGELNGQVRPLLTGQFGDQLASHFTDYFRCHTFSKPEPGNTERHEAFKKFFDVNDSEAKELITSTPKEQKSIYMWQTQSDSIAKHVKTSTMVGATKYVLANYNSFGKYKRKQITT